ncbi:hypothetical protein J2S30_000062 [Herbaspirillum rubrisubalbicans]|uniref:hypothetical protein n=1 Tax=Herbaspirillum rubrisubalbicans TaxID=80842 RepID=UPI001ED9AC1F|nr:hypothetical protein [Herbaspirillum rubrisubalbicans]MCP1571683.1 hypothetical protein [Herbaspirillum rubrisubalbicans]
MPNTIISWNAPIVPSHSLAGISIGLDLEEVERLLLSYLVERERNLYQFDSAPLLQLKRLDELNGDETFLFNVHDKDKTNWSLYFNTPDHAGANPRALAIIFRKNKVHAVKIWHFEKLKDGEKAKHIYRGKLPGNIGLGDPLRDLLSYTKLQYDEAEEWFYTDDKYGGLEVTGYGELVDYPEQVIMALAVISKSAYMEDISANVPR